MWLQKSLSSLHRQRKAREKRKTRAASYQGLNYLLRIHRNLQQGLHRESCLPRTGRTHHHSIFRSIHCIGRPKFTTQLTTNLIIMTPSPLYLDFMDVIRITSTIRDASPKYRFHSKIIKNLLTEFESHYNSRIIKEKKLLVEIINQIQITRCSKDIISLKHGNQSYIYWDIITTCVARVLMNASYEDIKFKYGITRSTMTIHLRNISQSLNCRNMRQLQQRMKTGEVLR